MVYSAIGWIKLSFFQHWQELGQENLRKKKERDQELAKLYRGLLEILFKLFRSDRKEVKKRFLNMRLPKKELAMWKSLRFGSNSVRFWPQASTEEKKSADRYAYSRDLTLHIPYLCQALNLCIHTAKTHYSTAPDRILDPEFRALLTFTFGLFPITSKMDEWIDEAVGSAPAAALGAPPRCFSSQCKNTENLGLCQGCCVAVYCGTACQRRDWAHHMNVCFKWKDYYPQMEEEIFKEEPVKLFVKVKKQKDESELAPSELVDLRSGGTSPEPISPRILSPDPLSPRLNVISPDPISPTLSPEPQEPTSPINRSFTPSPSSDRSESPISPMTLGPISMGTSEAQIRALVLGRTLQ